MQQTPTGALQMSQSATIFRKLKSHPSNKMCFDCNRKNPNWTSIPFGIYLCMDCSAVHRRMGTHITFVKSSVLDRWSEDQIAFMIAGGNQNAKEFFKQRGWTDRSAQDRKDKYTSRAALLYRQVLEQEARKATTKIPKILDSPSTDPRASPTQISDIQDDMGGLAALENEIKTKISSSPSSKMFGKEYISSPSPSPSPASTAAVDPELAHKVKMKEPPRVVIRKKSDAKPVTLGKGRTSRKKGSLLYSGKKPLPKPNKGIVKLSNSSTGDDIDKVFEGKLVLENKKETPVKTTPKAKAVSPVRAKTSDNDQNGTSSKSSYASAKSISSDQYFNRGAFAPTTQEDRERLEKFDGARAIGSDQFFDRQPMDDGDDADEDLSGLTESIAVKTRELRDSVSNFFNDISSRYG